MLAHSASALALAGGLLLPAPAYAEVKEYQIRRMLMLKTECTVTGLDTARIADDPRLRERFLATCENVSHYPDGVEIVCPDTEDERDCTLLTAKREFPHLRLLAR
ncbi:hypothetical protein ASG52_19255 [Methylobacterium sp. Leaf456]|uniref:hypothetical protein n=1 Tax=Methylobacterium sp. Leaf456 TaxID=1736382 RepID=UPI000700C74A|nr:hypothetical protein [Methylobacterium sp. Leaf456]KQT59883.1 hypothetical protein ASG52_19255 [Methylobacterium sp. Leaf456]